jgi:hypothetical protein
MSDDAIVQCMEEVWNLCSAANSVRARHDIRNRQPLENLDIVSKGGKFSYLAFMPDVVQVIKDECNVKHVTVIDDQVGVFVV